MKMMIPPIVGVPAFSWWPSGPSSRMFWPNSRTRRKSMNLGLRKMQMSSAAVPPMRISPMSGGLLERFGDDLESDAARALDEHGVAVLEQLGQQRRGLRGIGDRLVAVHRCRARPDGHERVDAAFPRVQADRLVEALGLRPQLEH